jgi:hypothetical protein
VEAEATTHQHGSNPGKQPQPQEIRYALLNIGLFRFYIYSKPIKGATSFPVASTSTLIAFPEIPCKASQPIATSIAYEILRGPAKITFAQFLGCLPQPLLYNSLLGGRGPAMTAYGSLDPINKKSLSSS